MFCWWLLTVICCNSVTPSTVCSANFPILSDHCPKYRKNTEILFWNGRSFPCKVWSAPKFAESSLPEDYHRLECTSFSVVIFRPSVLMSRHSFSTFRTTKFLLIFDEKSFFCVKISLKHESNDKQRYGKGFSANCVMRRDALVMYYIFFRAWTRFYKGCEQTLFTDFQPCDRSFIWRSLRLKRTRNKRTQEVSVLSWFFEMCYVHNDGKFYQFCKSYCCLRRVLFVCNDGWVQVENIAR